MKKFFAVFFVCFLVICNAFADAKITAKQGSLWVENATYAEVEELFKKYNFVEFGRQNLQIPRIYIKTLPIDWKNIEKSDDKNRMFIRILLPLIMKINEEIEIERSAIRILVQKENAKTLSKKEQKVIEEKALNYDVFTHNKGENRYKILLEELMKKVDGLPPAFLIAYAGVYSDWGNSRLAVEGNSLFREEVWYSDDGIVPEDVPNAEFRYRRFSSLEECLKSFIHKVNSNITYRFVWTARTESDKIGRKVLGEQIIAAMSYEGKLKNVTGMLDYNLSYYKLNKTDIFPTLRDVEAK